MLEKWLYRFTADKPCRLIYKAPGKPYLERYFLVKKFGVTAYLHRFVEPDRNEGLHNHPMSALAIVLDGWYYEQRLVDAHYFDGDTQGLYQGRKLRRFSISFIRRGFNGTYHKILDARRNTWTLFMHFPSNN